jgi:ABC-type phosphate transport system substrate-binding protein
MRIATLVLAGFILGGLAHAEQDELVVITNRATPVDRIGADQAAQIFLKQIQAWPDGTAIQPVDLKESSPLRAEFYGKVTGRRPGQLRAYWARQAFTGMGLPPKEVATSEEVARFVQRTPGAIGYVDRKDVDDSVKIVLIPGR